MSVCRLSACLWPCGNFVVGVGYCKSVSIFQLQVPRLICKAEATESETLSPPIAVHLQLDKLYYQPCLTELNLMQRPMTQCELPNVCSEKLSEPYSLHCEQLSKHGVSTEKMLKIFPCAATLTTFITEREAFCQIDYVQIGCQKKGQSHSNHPVSHNRI